jgi:hypothetical protein
MKPTHNQIECCSNESNATSIHLPHHQRSGEQGRQAPRRAAVPLRPSAIAGASSILAASPFHRLLTGTGGGLLRLLQKFFFLNVCSFCSGTEDGGRERRLVQRRARPQKTMKRVEKLREAKATTVRRVLLARSCAMGGKGVVGEIKNIGV